MKIYYKKLEQILKEYYVINFNSKEGIIIDNLIKILENYKEILDNKKIELSRIMFEAETNLNNFNRLIEVTKKFEHDKINDLFDTLNDFVDENKVTHND